MSSPVNTESAKLQFQPDEACSARLDAEDALSQFRSQFLFPKSKNGADVLYFAGNSLGLQPKNARRYIVEELEDWERLGVEGHWGARHPWMPYHENLTEMTARLVGAKPIEVVVMNTLTVNLHLMMVSFYRPTKTRYKILIESGAFPSDQYAVASQARFHGFDPEDAVISQKPRDGESLLRSEDILETIERHGDSIALVLFGQVNYLTGQAFDMERITAAAHAKGCVVGFDLAHGAGNLAFRLHDWNVDFAVWCGYKYLNSGPGALAGCFVHERHANNAELPRFAGWWGHDKATRFRMGPQFTPIAGAEGWQLSNPPIFQLAALRASLELFDQATMVALRQKSEKLTAYLEFLLRTFVGDRLTINTPSDPQSRGCQLSCRMKNDGEQIVKALAEEGIICDFRNPDVLRLAPVPLYNSFSDVYKLATRLQAHANGSNQ
jgi:kynureninase